LSDAAAAGKLCRQLSGFAADHPHFIPEDGAEPADAVAAHGAMS
jgi:hypothetical protein